MRRSRRAGASRGRRWKSRLLPPRRARSRRTTRRCVQPKRSSPDSLPPCQERRLAHQHRGQFRGRAAAPPLHEWHPEQEHPSAGRAARDSARGFQSSARVEGRQAGAIAKARRRPQSGGGWYQVIAAMATTRTSRPSGAPSTTTRRMAGMWAALASRSGTTSGRCTPSTRARGRSSASHRGSGLRSGRPSCIACKRRPGAWVSCGPGAGRGRGALGPLHDGGEPSLREAMTRGIRPGRPGPRRATGEPGPRKKRPAGVSAWRAGYLHRGAPYTPSGTVGSTLRFEEPVVSPALLNAVTRYSPPVSHGTSP